MSLLVDWQIRENIKRGEIVISPFDEKHLNTVSYDVSLGKYFVRAWYKKLGDTALRSDMLFNPKSIKSINRRWQEPEEAMPARLVFNEEERQMHQIGANDTVISLEPSELILAHTEEFIGGVSSVTTAMHARSSVGRSGISVCMCAGWGDVGYFNRWTMEIRNNGPYIIALSVGTRIAQISFESVEVPSGLYSRDGHYQNSGEISELKKSWKPEDMLPKPI